MNVSNAQGRCYDDAVNVSGDLSGLKTRILHIRCVAHTLNLVVQNVLTDKTKIKNFIGTAKYLIMFIKNSPRKLAIFKKIQYILLATP